LKQLAGAALIFLRKGRPHWREPLAALSDDPEGVSDALIAACEALDRLHVL